MARYAQQDVKRVVKMVNKRIHAAWKLAVKRGLPVGDVDVAQFAFQLLAEQYARDRRSRGPSNRQSNINSDIPLSVQLMRKRKPVKKV